MLNVNIDIQTRLHGGMDDELGVTLPFPAPLLYVINGMPAYKALNNAQYWGGWGVDAEKMDEAIQDTSAVFPLSFTEAVNENKDGKEYKIYCTRSVIVAPIGKRFSWVKQDGKQVVRSTQFFDGARMHIQVLGYMAQKGPEGKGIVPWGPVLLSAKGYQAGNVIEAFRAWKKVSAAARKQFASNLDSEFFYLPVGTFGTERVTETKGKGTAKSSITPLKPYLPQEIDEAYLTRMFVGEEVAATMATCKDEAEPWLAAWKESAIIESAKSNGHTEPDAPVDPPEEQGDEF